MRNELSLKTLSELLIHQKDQRDKGVSFIVAANKTNFLSYHQLYHEALCLLGYLQHKGLKPGDELVLQLDDSQQFIQYFWACILGGIIPVPVSVTHYSENARKLYKIRTYLKNPYIITTPAHYEKLCKQDYSDGSADKTFYDQVLFLEENKDNLPAGIPADVTPDDIAFLQFSSGSTGNPKGVEIRHRNLIANTFAVLEAYACTSDDIFLSWMPLTHDLGLIGYHLNPLAAGVQQYIMPTDLFIRHPLLWLQKSSDYRVTITCSPNFGYKYYLNHFTEEKGEGLDLSSVRIILNGAEPISASLSRTFNERMAKYKLNPMAMRAVYGLAEATLEITFPKADVPFQSVFVKRDALTIGKSITGKSLVKKPAADTLEVVAVGTLIGDFQLRIVNEKGATLPPGHAGVIWVKSACVASRYYNNDAASKNTFKDGWLNTGDTGFVLDDVLYIMGRVKDIIFVNGGNVYPHDIEHTLETLDEIDTGKVVAVGIPDEVNGSESIVVFVVHKMSAEKFLPMISLVKRTVAARLGLEVKQVIPVRKIFKTTSGKVRRHLFVEEYIKGAYKEAIEEIAVAEKAAAAEEMVVAPPVPAITTVNAHTLSRLKEWLEAWLKQHLHTTPAEMQAQRTFAEYGLTSILAVQLAADLEIFLQTPVENTVVFSYPTVQSLATHFAGMTLALPENKTTSPATDAAGNQLAVIGIGCRFPGNVNSPEAMWTLLKSSRDAVGIVPESRWDISAYYDKQEDAPGKMYTRHGGFIEHADQFDPLFFGISPREAAAMDPQQRLLLEVCREALEHAGIAPASLRGSDSGIFVGMSTDDYQQVIRDNGDVTYYEDVFTGLGVERSIAAGRIAYLLDFHGPALQLDTACSSSLLSVYQAAQSLLRKECSLALAGGVNLMLSPDTTIKLCRMKALSPTGQCKTFDDNADGYVRGEGAGVVVLKRLEDAVAAGDNILAVIRGGAVNHDGQSNGLTAPNGMAQQQLIEKALHNAAVDADSIQYIETHGTGTRLGDPVEVLALNAVYGRSRKKEEPLLMGALKSNIGHLEAAAGIAGFIKTVLSLQHRQIPASLHFNTPNRFIPWKDMAVKVADILMPWPAAASPRRAAVSAFGLSGTNVHMILEEALAVSAPEEKPLPAYPLLLSAKTPAALETMVSGYVSFLPQSEDTIAAIARTMATGRDAFPYRIAWQAASKEDAAAQLQAYVAGRGQHSVSTGDTLRSPGKIAWLFTGQGAQYWNMGRELYDNNAVFKRVVDDCDAFLKKSWPFSLTDLLYKKNPEEANALLRQTIFTQPALFVIECALAEVWKSWGVVPDIVLGHSAGEYAAAYAAGVFSLYDGLALITARAALMNAVTEEGSMAVVFTTAVKVAAAIQSYGNDLAIAAINGPELTVISGKTAALRAVTQSLKQAGIGSREMQVSHAFHSPLMEPVLKDFHQIASGVQYHLPVIPLVSNVTGAIAGKEVTDAAYWGKHILWPVLFSQSIQTLKEAGEFNLMELGPQPSLLSMAQLTLKYEEHRLLPVMREGRSSWTTMLHALMALHVKGITVNWPAFYATGAPHKAILPTYPFQRQRYWIEKNTRQPKDKLATVEEITIPKNTPMSHKNHLLPNSAGYIADYLADNLRRLLKMSPSDELNVHVPFLSQGADSLIMASLVRKIENEYGLSFSMRLIFEELISIQLMAEYISAHATVFVTADSMPVAAPVQETTVAAPSPAPPPSSSPLPSTLPAPVLMPHMQAPGGYNVIQDTVQLMQQQLNVIAQQFQWMSQGMQPAHSHGNGNANGHTNGHPAASSPHVNGGAAAAPANTPAAAPKKGVSIFPKIETKPGQKYAPEQQAYLDAFIEKYTTKTKTSKALTERYRPVLADNRVSAGFRFATKEMVYPIVAASSLGSKMRDVDGNEYVDLTMGFGVNLLGHRPEIVTAAIHKQLEKGYQLGPQTYLAGEVATRISALTGMDRVSFHNSGTEAVMSAMRLARTTSGKKKIAIFLGSYHGYFDGTLAMVEDIEHDHNGIPIAPGVIPNMVADVLVFDYLNPNVVEQIRAHAHELAAVLVEPIQSRRPGYQPKALLQELRAMTEQEKIILIFDEMITGFRIHPGGVQAHFGIRADMVTYGKIAGGGMPIGIIAGKDWCMQAFDGGLWNYKDDSYPKAETTFLAGTFCKHPLSMVASLAVLGELERQGPALQEKLNMRTNRLIGNITKMLDENQVPIKVNNFGSLFYFSISGNMDLFFYHLLEKGVYIWEGKTCFLSAAHTDDDIDFIEKCFRDTITDLQRAGFLPQVAPVKKKVAPVEAAVLNVLPTVIEKQERPAHIPLSFSQERLWFIDQLEGSVQYNLPAIVRLKGHLDKNALTDALQLIVDRHEILRTNIYQEEGHACQRVQESVQWQLEEVEDPLYQHNAAALQTYIASLVNMPFKLSEGNMLRAYLIRVSATEHVLVMIIHHIVFDDSSAHIFFQELIEIYNARLNGRQPVLPALKIQYADFALWQRRFLQGPLVAQKLAYWKKKLDGVTLLQLPTDFERPVVRSTRGAVITMQLDKELSARVKQMGRQQGVTLFTTLLTALKVLMYRYSGQEDICIGCATAGRAQVELEPLLGFFVNTLALRSNLSGNPSFAAALKEVQNTLFDAHDNQEVPFEKVVMEVMGERDIRKNPLFQVMFTLQNIPLMSELRLGEATMTPEPVIRSTSLFDIFWTVEERPDGIALEVEYCIDLFRETTILRMMHHYMALLEAAVQNAATTIGELKMLSAEETHQLLVTFNDNVVPYPVNKTITALFEEQVANAPDAIALSFGEQQLTYRELEEQSNRVAHYLRKQGVKEGVMVPLCMERSIHLIVSILGILKAGGAYVPVDPAYPKDRIAYMLHDTASKLVLTTTDQQALLAAEAEQATLIFVDNILDLLAAMPAYPVGVKTDPDSLAYVIYTSGSTGRPKGAMVVHRNVTSLARGGNFVELSAADTLLSTGSPSFDATTIEYWGMLLNGGQLVLCPEKRLLDNQLLKQEIRQRGVTKMWFTASWFNQLVDDDISIFEGLTAVMAGGEKLSEEHIRKFRAAYPATQIINGYGPTENTTFSLTWNIAAVVPGKSIPIGRPLANRTAYVLDSAMQLLPVGTPGELYVGGAGVSRGYLNQPELTAEKFVTDPFSEQRGARLYRTGDRARWLPDGTVEYLGRMDDQIKMRGYRIEPGEIERALNNLEAVAASCVVVKEQQGAEKKLVSYYVPDQQAVLRTEQELYLQQVATWKELYETAYSKADEVKDLDGEFNITGWNDSFTGEAIPAQNMRSWLEDITSVVLSTQPRNVLEIGCGTGLIYFQLAGHIEKYIGTDFSQVSTRQLQQHIDKGLRRYPATTLKVCAAHEVTLEEGASIDTVILNSIVQYFPGAQYMSDVLDNAISLLKGKGHIVIGDVRDLRLLPSFKRRLQLDKLQSKTSLREFEWNVDQEVWKEEELCFSPAYFFQLQSLYPEITHVEIQWKQGDYLNELTLYRYTVVLHLDIEKPVLQPQWQAWDEITDKHSILSRFAAGQPRIALQHVPNPRLWKERLLEQALTDRSINQVGDLADYILTPDNDTKVVNDILAAAKVAGYQCRFLLNEDPFKINLLIEQVPFNGFVEPSYSKSAGYTEGVKTNIPLFPDICEVLEKDIRVQLQQRLPEYMVPFAFVAMQLLPLTSNGKVDRRFLTEWEFIQRKRLLNYQAPVTATEQQLADIWQRLLGVERIGTQDNFFELGGHSLLATRAVSAIRKEMEAELTVKDFFLHPTVASLATYLQLQHKGLLLPALFAAERPVQIPLSFSQERLWFIDQLEGSVSYHMPVVLRLKGALDNEALGHAIGQIVHRHESLRTVIRQEQGKPYQQFLDKHLWQLTEIDDAALSADGTALQEYITHLVYQPFDLANDFMLRAHLLRVSTAEQVLVLVMHHIASDGWSVSILVNELIALYRAHSTGSASHLPALDIQYADYAIWQRTHLEGAALKKRLVYWQEKLAGVEVLHLPTDYSRPPIQSTRGAISRFRLDKELRDQLQVLSQQQGTTLFMTLLTAFKVLLYRYSGQDDICVGTTIAGRTQQEAEGLIGFFVNTLPLRSDLSDDPTFITLLQQVKETTLDAYDHQDAPFEKIVEVVEKDRDMSRTALFQVMFELFNMPDAPDLKLGELHITQEEIPHTVTLFDLSCCLQEDAHGLSGYIEYCVDLFTEESMQRLVKHFEQLLQFIVQLPAAHIGSIPMLRQEEEQQLLVDFNNTAVAFPQDKTFIDLFVSQAAITPGAPAVIAGDTVLSYKALDERSNQLAHYLIGEGVTGNSLVPVCLERSADMIVAILGILKAGAAYVPVDPEYPAARIAYILDDCNAPLIVSSSYANEKISDITVLNTFLIDGDAATLDIQPVTPLFTAPAPNDLAYIIYTSGSTGKPKGVMVEHAGMLNHLFAKVNDLKMDADSILAYTAAYTFDISVWQMFAALLSGGRTVVYTETQIHQPAALLRRLSSDGITVLELVPSYLAAVLMEESHVALESLQYLLVTGEPVSQALLTKWFSHAAYGHIPVVNAYGPTEASDDITHHFMYAAPARNNVPLGKPIQNLRIYILDTARQLCPVGVAGEICVSGVGVSRGYLNDPEKTAAKFIKDPFHADGAIRMYRTGDLGRWLPDGSIEMLGRIDEQVKIRGYRIELGEIENVLQQFPGVKSAVVLSKGEGGDRRLVGYVAAGEGYDRDALVVYLKERLPEYMVPEQLIALDRIPLTPNGKVDKKALPEADMQIVQTPYEAPGNEIEEILEDICKKLLETERVSINDNLFGLGMHSLLVMRLSAAVQEKFGLHITVRTFFKLTTIKTLAAYIKISQAAVPETSEGLQEMRL
ncbi:non-ribosomal peptide synthetase/type I polyketide synthase [Chitinophaga varians]|uniref:non-ribosomal peptide synthetase/type I polyketide synthase n=1 Tax=Chitinophaga varians TaxID=2202339 RepID=UPI00165F58D8|nr:non-ribosomal peptide synthetase/type I polyketide synthase [Chitinophaga varians]MBC9909358.1 amino acid adenylation domain-containing protein [Chitinophaga varians]